MISWSRKRRFIYAGSALIVLLCTIAVSFFMFVYQAPTCSDGIRNGAESGVDCGGGCVRLCASAFLPPSISWTRFEEAGSGLYNIATYIVNPNKEGEARRVPYHVMVYDSRGMLIVEHRGVTDIPPQRSVLVFDRMVDMGKRIPARALFEFTSSPEWRSAKDTLNSLVIGEKKYTEEGSSSALTVTLTNNSVYMLPSMSVYAVLYDIDNNVIGFSKTILDMISPKETVLAPFTWPVNREGKVVSIEVLPVAQ